MRKQVERNMDEKASTLPQASSPYFMLNGETENGSPIQQFVKVQKPAKYVTGTPMKRRVFAPIERNDGSPELPSRAIHVSPPKRVCNIPKENETPIQQSTTEEALVQGSSAELITGSLASACSIM